VLTILIFHIEEFRRASKEVETEEEEEEDEEGGFDFAFFAVTRDADVEREVEGVAKRKE
jgi:hypothetical protein